jgi:hypothetical protein
MALQPVVQNLTPSTPFTLDVQGEAGMVRLGLRLSYDFNALVLVEQGTGYSLLSGTIFNHLNVNNVSILLWAALRANHPEYRGDEGLERVRALLTLRNSDSVVEAVQECFIKNLPDDQQARIRKAIDDATKKKAAIEAGQPEEGASPLAVATPATA